MSISDPAASTEPIGEDAAAEPVVCETEVEVRLERSVRVGRVVIGAAVAGVLIAALLALLFPVAEKADYTLGQVVGFMALIGGAIGLGVGGMIVLLLASAAKRRRGTGIAIQSDVR